MKTEANNRKEEIVEQAAAFHARMASGHVSAEDWRELEAWLAADAEHRRVFRAMEEMSFALRPLREHAKALPEMEDAARLAAGKSAQRSVKPRYLAVAAGLILAFALSFLFLGQESEQPAARVISTVQGERQTFELDDGSRATLAANTEASILIDGEQRRFSLLKGQVYLDISTDSNRPFRTWVGNHVIEVTGTAFDVRYRDREARVTLFEGEVKVFPDPSQGLASAGPGLNRTVQLKPGQQIELRKGASVVQLDTDALQAAADWQDGWLHFENATLQQVISELRWHVDKPIVLASRDIAELPVGGSFNVDRLDAVMMSLESLLPVKVVERSGQIVIEQDEGVR